MSKYKDINTIQTPNKCLTWFLVHSYLYYKLDKPIISDADFDKIVHWLKLCWDNVDHPHKALVSMDDLNAGTGFAIKYPRIVEGTAKMLVGLLEEEKPKAKKARKKIAKKRASAKKKPTTTFDEYDSLFG